MILSEKSATFRDHALTGALHAVLQYASGLGIHADLVRHPTVLDVEGIAQAAATPLVLQFLIRDLAVTRRKRNRARLRQAYSRNIPPALGPGGHSPRFGLLGLLGRGLLRGAPTFKVLGGLLGGTRERRRHRHGAGGADCNEVGHDCRMNDCVSSYSPVADADHGPSGA